MNSTPVKGLHYVLEGISLIKQPQLRSFVLAPLVVSFVVYSVLGYFCVSQFDVITSALMAYLPDWEWLMWLIQTVLTLSIILIFTFTFTMLTNFIASPFLSLLAEKTELFITGQPINTKTGWAAALKSVPLSLAREVQKLLYYFPRLLLVLIITIIPGINSIAPIIWFMFGAWMMSVQYLDYPIDANQLNFAALKSHLKNNRASTLVFGAFITLLLMIPFVSIIIVPAAVAGATAFWAKEEKNKL